MAPYQIRDESLVALRRAIRSMLAPGFLAQLRDESDQAKLAWADTLLSSDLARDRLELVALGEIRHDLRRHEKQLREAADDLTEASGRFDRAAELLDSAARFVTLLSRLGALGLS